MAGMNNIWQAVQAQGQATIAADASSVTIPVTGLLATSLVFAEIASNDVTAVKKNVVAGSGAFTVNLTANATAATTVNYFVIF